VSSLDRSRVYTSNYTDRSVFASPLLFYLPCVISVGAGKFGSVAIEAGKWRAAVVGWISCPYVQVATLNNE
jgi:hypothetical protein